MIQVGDTVYLQSNPEWLMTVVEIDENERDEAFAKGLDLLTEDLKRAILSGKTKVDKATICNLPKIADDRSIKFYNFFPIGDIETLNAAYSTYREKEAKKAALPVVANPVSGVELEQRTKGLNPKFLRNQGYEEKTGFDGSKIKISNLPERDEIKQIISKATEVGSQEDLLKALDNAGAEVLVEISGSFLLKNNLADYWKNLRQLEKPITSSFTDYITWGQAKVIGLFGEALPVVENPVSGSEKDKEIEKLRKELDYFKNLNFKHSGELTTLQKEHRKLQDECDEAKDQLYNIQKAFGTSTTDDRIKLCKKGFTLMRCTNSEKITFFDAQTYSWKLYGKFESKAAAAERVKELKKESDIIFEI